ncbi:hypothetical protein [Nannocystis radixulma]|uniref:Uncharacterized protein n=1 Tax=Nannocystis radixulma TaxID=2995305 RepID=A0ABT5BA84_9BACT|nr:hypothetical protein [Nannocystis radixulma]MDC0670525.1 hypothetical protein [Nannocystis radixulma]
MNPRTFGLLVALTAACSDSGTPPATDGSQATDAGTSPSTSTTTAASTSTGEPTTSGTSTTTSTSGVEPGTSTSTTDASTSTTDASTTQAPDDDPVCGVVDGDHGDCEQVLGWAFDGVECTKRSGCDCAPDCNKFFEEANLCARECAWAGRCNLDQIVGWGMIEGPVGIGQVCDDIRFCDLPGLMAEWSLEFIFPFMWYSENFPAPCTQGGGSINWYEGDPIDEDTWTGLCAASMLPGLGPAWCILE